jgi:hypothetical protein
MLQGWLARMCRFTYGLLTEDGLSNILFRNVCLVYMTSMSKVTLWLCVLDLDTLLSRLFKGFCLHARVS